MHTIQHITILDVLENTLGGDLTAKHIGRLTDTDLENLADRVNEFYYSYAPHETEDDLLFYSGGTIAGNWQTPNVRTYLFTSLIYYPKVIIHDPIADWFYPRRETLLEPPGLPGSNGAITVRSAEPTLLRGDGYYAHRADPERTRSKLASIVPIIGELAPLFRNGTIIPISQWQLVQESQRAILTAIRHDVNDDELANVITNPIDIPVARSDQIRGLTISPNGGWKTGHERRASVQDPAYFLNKTLAIADAAGARYVPPAATDAALLEQKVKRLGDEFRQRSRSIDLVMTPALESAHLPFLENLSPKTLVAIRTDEGAFDDWRRELRSVVRNIEAKPTEGTAFAQESSEILRDALLPRAREVSAAASTSATLKRVVAEQGVTLTIGTASALGTTATLNTPISAATLVGLGMSAIARCTYGAIFRKSPAGSRAVMAKLIRAQKPSKQ